jgi:hypothetical protein
MLPLGSLVSQMGTLSQAWIQWFARADATIEAQRGHGPTAARPGPEVAYVGMQFFDDTLGHPIWASSVTPVGVTGVTWVDATGSTV